MAKIKPEKLAGAYQVVHKEVQKCKKKTQTEGRKTLYTIYTRHNETGTEN